MESKFLFLLGVSISLFFSCANTQIAANNDPEEQEIELRASSTVKGTTGKVKVDETGQVVVVDQFGRPVRSICSHLRINGGYELFEYSKKYLSEYYKTRNLKELFIAWYFSEDSRNLAVSVRSCADKKNKHYYALRTLLRRNSVIQDLITVNMRTREHANLAELYMDEYYELFPKDIK